LFFNDYYYVASDFIAMVSSQLTETSGNQNLFNCMDGKWFGLKFLHKYVAFKDPSTL